MSNKIFYGSRIKSLKDGFSHESISWIMNPSKTDASPALKKMAAVAAITLIYICYMALTSGIKLH